MRREVQLWLWFCGSVRLPFNARCLNPEIGKHTGVDFGNGHVGLRLSMKYACRVQTCTEVGGFGRVQDEELCRDVTPCGSCSPDWRGVVSVVREG